jgi:hypothetical protein
LRLFSELYVLAPIIARYKPRKGGANWKVYATGMYGNYVDSEMIGGQRGMETSFYSKVIEKQFVRTGLFLLELK